MNRSAPMLVVTLLTAAACGASEDTGPARSASSTAPSADSVTAPEPETASLTTPPPSRAPLAAAKPTSAPETEPPTASEPAGTLSSSRAMSADEIYESMTESEIVDFGGPECARELAAIAAAGEQYIEREGRQPDSLDDLADDLEEPVELWEFDAEHGTLRPTPGSGCVDLAELNARTERECQARYSTLEVAVDAYYAANETWASDQQQLIDGGFIREVFDDFTLGPDGTILVESTSRCDNVTSSVTTLDCERAYRELQVAVEAYFATHQSYPTDPFELYDAGLIDGVDPNFDLEPDGNVVASPSGWCADLDLDS